MFELTNEQRKCFALPPVLNTWKKIEVKPGRYNQYHTYVYLDGQRIMKVIQVNEDLGQEKYDEYSVDQLISEDGTMLLPKTEKGKPQKFTVPNLERKTRIGMALFFGQGALAIWKLTSTGEQAFYGSVQEGIEIPTFKDFEDWVDDWCRNTGEKELAEINEFANKKITRQKYNEGDFFRYRINRSLYGYGRILLNFDKMRKEGIDFWDMFMGKPLCVAVYHIVTENKNILPEQLIGKKMLPSHMIMDNIFYYGECEIIGNLPLVENEMDYPIHYGSYGWNCVRYQCGKTYLIKNKKVLYDDFDFRNAGIGWNLNISLPILRECIKQDSNEPYWTMNKSILVTEDLRNPKFKKELIEIKKQFGIK